MQRGGAAVVVVGFGVVVVVDGIIVVFVSFMKGSIVVDVFSS